MDERLNAFRQEAATVRSGAGRKFPKSLIAAGGQFARARRDEGASWSSIAAELEVGVLTARRWAGREVTSAPAFHRVTVVEKPARGSIAAVLPGGIRLEGLDLASIIELARALS